MTQPITSAVPTVNVRSLLALALPSMGFVVLTNAYRSVDQYWVKDLGTDAQAAIGASVFVLIALYSTFQFTSAGASALVARATGANDPERRRKVLGGAIFFSLLLSVALALVGLVLADPIAQTVGLEGESARLCALYLRAITVSALPLALTPLVDQAWVSMGNTRLPMLLQGLSLGFNVMLTPWMMFEHGALGGLGLGIVGAALASNASRLVSTGLGLWLLAKETELSWLHIRPNVELPKVLRIGTPAALGVFLYAAVYWVMLRTAISPLGPQLNAALGIGFSALEGISWPCYYGISLALGSLVGRSLGAQRPELAKRAVKLAFPLMTGTGLLVTVVFYYGGELLTGLFTDDPLVHREATRYAMILAASQLAVAWESLSEGALLGAGDTRTVTWISVPFNLLRVPLAWLTAGPLGFGAAGIWWVINFTTWCKCALKGVALLQGKWLKLRI